MKYLRLKKRKDIEKIMKKGKRCFSRTVTIVYLPSEKLKMAVCVGKKHGKSVQRNHIKRLIREAFRLSIGENVKGSFLLLPKVGEEPSFHTYQRDIHAILKRENFVRA